jgi:alkylhydroperoxidase family enzyme
MYQRYKNQATFLAVYVREAHPTDGWREPGNDKAGISFAQPRTSEERQKVAQQCCATLEITMPLLVDTLDDRVGHAYSGMPDRLYVIDRAGKVAYQGGRGPYGFKTGEMEQSLILVLLEDAQRAKAAAQTVRRASPGRLPLLSNEEAWKRLPPLERDKGAHPLLPAWARMLAGPLPVTTARMLELDDLHRNGYRLDARLQALVRWAAADAIACAYTKAAAAADLRRTGASPADLESLATSQEQLPTPERLAMSFARKMTRAAYSVTDDEVKQLIGVLGEERFVALVALLAHAGFQDRLLLALQVQEEPEGPLPPLAARFVRPEAKTPDHKASPEKLKASLPVNKASIPASAAWLGLQKNLDNQRARTGRIRVPSHEEVLKRVGPKHPGKWQTDILWSRVCYGFQPELTDAFFDCVAAFRQETALDRVFQQCVFWVATQSLQCFY